MPKSKKSDSDKAAKEKSPKALKAEKPAKEKKKTLKKEKDALLEPPAPIVTIAAPVEEKPAKAAKVTAKKTPAKKAAAPKPVKAVAPEPEIVISIEDISLRAYFIAERRQAMGWPGDSTSDWVEAERQLKAEAKRSKR